MITDSVIGFIGAGNMASALIRGLLADGCAADKILVHDTNSDKVDELVSTCGITGCPEKGSLVAQADIVVLAVKPQVMETVVSSLSETLESHSCLLISVAAGITLQGLRDWSHTKQSVVRCMPNTPALVGVGASALFANDCCSEKQKQQAQSILEAVGTAVWVDKEAELDVVTALSGSGPAYFFLLLEAMQETAVKLGLSDDVATSLSLQTALGAATLASKSDVSVAELRRRVTSPGGTTEAALRQFESEDFRGLVNRALGKAAQRSRELAQE